MSSNFKGEAIAALGEDGVMWRYRKQNQKPLKYLILGC